MMVVRDIAGASVASLDIDGVLLPCGAEEATTSGQQQGPSEEACQAPMPLERNLSIEYVSRGSSRYDEDILQRWQRHRDVATEALRGRKWVLAAEELRQAVVLRPDWAQGSLGLCEVLVRLGEHEEAAGVLHRAAGLSLARLRRSVESGMAMEGIIDDTMRLVGKLVEKTGPDAPCRLLGSATREDTGDTLLLYRNLACNATWLASAPRPLRLVFLDIDGVLNTAGAANSGVLDVSCILRLREVLESARAVVVLSSSWRSFDELRPLALSCLPPGRIIGQTAVGFQNHTRPREIFDLLCEPRVQGALCEPGAAWAAIDDMDLVSQAKGLATSDRDIRAFVPQLERCFVRTDKHIGLDATGAARLLHVLGG